MKKWNCEVCGYTHRGEECPEECPQCGAPRTMFFRKRTCFWNMLYACIILIMIGAVIFSFFSCTSSVNVDNSTVKTLDVNRYMGKWYEIARFDHSFERDMTHCTATYSLRADGKIKVVNEGKKHGKWKVTEGKAKLTNTPGLLRVSFWGPFYSDYRVMMLAPDYSYVLVGGSSDEYLWILARSPQLDKESFDKIINEAQRRGYDTDKLWYVYGNDN